MEKLGHWLEDIAGSSAPKWIYDLAYLLKNVRFR